MKEIEMLERVWEPRGLVEAWWQVKRNVGATGIDRMSVKGFEKREVGLLRCIYRKLKSGEYRFKPARRVLIPKEGSTAYTPISRYKNGL
jgi:retron-type reverse transcriptase